MNPQMKKRVLVVGGVVALGAVAYWLYSKSQAAAAAPAPLAPAPAPRPLPQPAPAPATKQPSSSLQAALADYQRLQADMANQSSAMALLTQTELAAMRLRILAQAKVEGVTVNV